MVRCSVSWCRCFLGRADSRPGGGRQEFEPADGADANALPVQTRVPRESSELGLYRGNVMHLEMSIDQMFMLRPFLGMSGYKTHLKGLFVDKDADYFQHLLDQADVDPNVDPPSNEFCIDDTDAVVDMSFADYIELNLDGEPQEDGKKAA